MALDQVEVMKSFGFDKFAVVGHDRGGRVGHRLALDHADKVTRLAVLDIIPTYYLYTHVDPRVHPGLLPLVQLRAPGAGAGERSQGAVRGAEGARDHRGSDRVPAHVEPARANIHGMCEDYRAGASIDLEHDDADLSQEDRMSADDAVGRSRDRWAASTTCWPSGRSAA